MPEANTSLVYHKTQLHRPKETKEIESFDKPHGQQTFGNFDAKAKQEKVAWTRNLQWQNSSTLEKSKFSEEKFKWPHARS